LNKAIEASPNDEKTRKYLGLAYFEAGKHLFENRDYDAARESFESARHFNPDCTQCQSYIEKSKLGPLLAHRSKGIEDFNKNEYLSAIFELEEFLQARPDDGEIRIYLSKAYYQQALIDYNRGDFLTAKKGFDSALEYDPDCQKCQAYINQSLNSYKEAHYNKGIAFFGKEQLAQAIAEWTMVHEIDPNYKDVDQNLKRARSLMEKLEQIKKSQQ
jgi:tetratricopeptide (TPR) repeat protein